MEKEYRILIIEDDNDISELISLYLTKEGMQVSIACDGEEGLSLFNSDSWDLLVLDLNLPGMDGFQVLSEIRLSSSMPILICSAREADEDIIRGLSNGADDFISKPFSPKVLCERVKANLRRVESGKSDSREFYSFDKYRFYVDGYYLEKDGLKVKMAGKELDVLYLLIKNAGKPLTVWEIFREIWGAQFGDVATVAVHIQRIRRKIEKKESKYIFTSYGLGYYFSKDKLIEGERK